MPVEKYMKWKQKVLLGASLKVIAPTGQYDPTKLINWGTNRWVFQGWRKWVLDEYLGVWFITTNSDFLVTEHLLFGHQIPNAGPHWLL
jgi:hypothetical protein